MGDKKPQWSDYAYDSESISKRLGIDKEEVKKLKAEAKQKLDSELGVDFGKNNFTGGLDIDRKNQDIGLKLGIKVPGFGLSIDSQGGGEIDIAKFIQIKTVRLKCFFVQRFYFAGQFLYSDIQRVDSPECNEKPEPEPEPEPDPSLNDIEPEPKLPKSPKIPNFSEPLTGFYSGRRIVYYKSTYLDEISVYRGVVSSQIKRLELHTDPFSDIWEITYKIVWSSRGSKHNQSYKRFSKRYYCLAPQFLISKGEIIFRNRRYYYKIVSDENEVRYNFRNNNSQETPYGRVGFSTELDGASSASETFFDNGYWCGGQISGNSQSCAYLLRGYTQQYKTEFVTYHHTYENKQIINFLNLVPKQKINNPPILRLTQGEEEMDKCCKKLAKILGADKFPISLSLKEIEDYSNEMNKRIQEEPEKKIDFEDYIEFCKFKDLIQQQSIRDIAKSTGVEEFKKEKEDSEGNPLFWYFKYLGLIASGFFELAPSFKEWIANGKPGLSQGDNQGSENEGDKIDNIPKLLSNQNQLVQDIHRVLGIDEFPASMPETFLSQTVTLEDGTVEVKEPEQVEIPNYAQAFGYLLDRLDELIGQFDLTIEVKDTDPYKQGDQAKTIKIGNLSEGIAEIIGLIYAQGVQSSIDAKIGVKNMVVLGLIQKVMTQMDAAIDEIVEHLEMPYKEVPKEINLEYTPTSKDIDIESFIKSSSISVNVIERLAGKNNPTIGQTLKYLTQVAAIMKAQNFRKFSPTDDIAVQLFNDFQKGVTDKNDVLGSKKDGEWKDFKEQVEKNFRDWQYLSGDVDLDRSDNPKIVDLSEQSENRNKGSDDR